MEEEFMRISMFAMAIGTFAPMLSSLSQNLDKGGAHARARGTDPSALVAGRLAPDMYPLSAQVRLACDHAAGAAARLTGRDLPAAAEDEATIEGMIALIARTIRYLEASDPAGFDGADDREIVLPLGGGLTLEMSGDQFLRDWALPHFYFHVVTAYDILRNAGVDIGKRDYMSHIVYAIHQRGESQTNAASPQ
jgi:hypothetical protein